MKEALEAIRARAAQQLEAVQEKRRADCDFKADGLFVR